MNATSNSGEAAADGGDSQFYLRIRGRIDGPFDVTTLQSMAARGRFARHHEVSRDRTTWQRASEFPELFPARTERRNPVRGAGRSAARRDDASRYRLEQQRAMAASGNPAPSAAGRPLPDVQPVPFQSEPSWYYTTPDGEHGPVTETEVRDLLASGELPDDAWVWSAQLPDWIPARDLVDRGPSAVADVPRSWTTAPTSGMAVTSLVLGILSLGLLALPVISVLSSAAPSDRATLLRGIALGLVPLIGAVLTLVFGHIALADIRHSAGQRKGRGVALAGLIMGYGVLFVFIVSGIVLAVFLLLGAATAERS